MRWQLASTFAAMAMSGCYGESTVACPNGVLCPSNRTCTGNAPSDDPSVKLCAVEADVIGCIDTDEGFNCDGADGPGLCVNKVCEPCRPELFRCRYATWTSVPSPVDTQLLGVFVAAPDRAYAVGGSGVVLTYDGRGWSAGIDGITFAGNPVFEAVWEVDGTVFVAGDIAVSTGGSTSAVPYPAATSLWGDRADNVVAGAGADHVGEYDGTWSWDPALSNPSFPLETRYSSVWGWSAENTVIAVGLGSIARRTSSWTTTAPPTLDALNGIWGASPDDFWVVGNVDNGEAPGVIFHYEAPTWSSNLAPPQTPTLTAIWGTSADDIFAVGDGGTILHYDGTAWTQLEHANSAADLTHISGSGTDVWTVGASGEIWRLSR